MIRIGQIANSHGINGELKVVPLTDDITRFRRLTEVYVEEKKDGYRLLTPKSSRVHKDMVLLTVAEIADKTAADRLKGKYLCVKDEDAIKLPEGRYFIFQLEGLTVVEDGVVLGTLTEVLQPGANDVYVVDDGKRKIYVPAIKSVILDVDLENKVMQVKLPEGLLD